MASELYTVYGNIESRNMAEIIERINKKIDLYVISIFLFFLAVFVFQIPKKNFGALILMASLLVSIVATKCKEISRVNIIINTLITICIFICVIFNDVELHSYYKRSQIYGVIILLILSIACNVKRMIPLILSYKEKSTFLLVCFVAFVVTVILNLDVVNAWTRWDSHIYFCAIQNMTVHNLISKNGLHICGHVCTGYALWSLLLKSIPYLDQVQIQHIGNIIQLFCDAVLLFYISKKITKRSNILCILIAVCGVLSPYMMGLVYVTYPERIVITGLLIYIYGLYSNNTYSKVLGIFLMLSKETVIPAAAIMVFVELVLQIAKNKKNWKEYNIGYYFLSLLIGVMWMLQYLNSGWGGTTKLITSAIFGSGQKEEVTQDVAHVAHEATIVYPLKDGVAFNKFGISRVHIIDTFKGVFLTNFVWLMVAIVMVSLFIMAVKKIKVASHNNLIVLLCGFVLHYLFTSTYVTYHFNRYYTLMYVFIFIILMIVVSSLIRKDMMMYIVYGVLGLLFLIQTYKTIDPFMLNVFPTYDTGKGKVMMLTQDMQNFHDPFFNDGVLYNKEVYYFDDAINKALSKCDIDKNTLIVFSDEYKGKIGVGALFSIWGFLYEDFKPIYYASWSNEEQRRALEFSDEKQIKYKFVIGTDDIEFSDYERVYYLEMPWGDTVITNMETGCTNETIAENYDWVIKVHQLK